jgi:hypothetical protein
MVLKNFSHRTFYKIILCLPTFCTFGFALKHNAIPSAKPKEQNFSNALVQIMKINCNFDKIVKAKISR